MPSIVAFHGTSAEFEVFKKPEENRMAMRADVGFWFTSSEVDANTYGQYVIQAELKMNKPRRITRKELDELSVSYPMDQVKSILYQNGCDALIVEAIAPSRILDEPGMPEQYVVRGAEQITILSKEHKRKAKP